MGGVDRSLSDVLRAAIAARGHRHLMLDRATGVARASILRFARGDQSLRLVKAERLAVFLGLELRATSPARG